jgi:hypothetical protein
MNPISLPLFVRDLVPDADIAAFKIVAQGASDASVKIASANTDVLLGVSSELATDQSEGEKCSVIHFGIAKVTAGDTITRGDYITTDANGDAIELSDTLLASGAVNSVGIALMSGVDDDIISILVYPQKVSKFDAVTASAAELNYNDITTLGTVQASKTVTADANKDITGARNFTITGSYVIGSASIDETDLEKIDGITNGTQAANKAVIADANANTGVSKVTELHIGASGAEVQVTATPAELNLLDLSAQTETIDSGVDVSVTKRITKIDNTTSGAGAITLAAPDATMLGQVKIIEMTVDGGDVTLSLANVDGGTAGTTATFDAVGKSLILIGGVSKWHVIGEAGVILS